MRQRRALAVRAAALAVIGPVLALLPATGTAAGMPTGMPPGTTAGAAAGAATGAAAGPVAGPVSQPAEPALRPVAKPASHSGQPYCGDRGSAGFPLRARIHGGPRGYAPGGGWGHWSIGLRNDTRKDCRSIHPVAVLVDSTRRLDADRIALHFYDPYDRSWRRASLETTEEREHIAVFDGFRGFAVPAGEAVTVRVRMRFARGTAENRVRVTVAAVQRRAGDGDWVGSSNRYAFAIRPSARNTAGTREADPLVPGGPSPHRRSPDELARTGPPGSRPWPATAATAGACLLTGTALRLAARRRRR